MTHSGSVFSAMLRTHRRLEYSLAVSSGQELVTTTADYLAYALAQARDPRGRPGAGDAARRRRAAGRARPRGRARRPGRRADRRRLAARPDPGRRPLRRDRRLDDAAWEALFAAYGVHRVDDLGELADSLECFAIGRRVRRRRGGIATVHDSGAERVLAADVAERAAASRSRPCRTPPATAWRALLDPGSSRPTRSTSGAPAPTPRSCSRDCLTALADDADGRRGRARRRPGAGVRRRRVLPPGPRPARRPHRQAGRRAVQPRGGGRPGAGRGRCATSGSRCSRAPGPGCAPSGTCATTRCGRPTGAGARSRPRRDPARRVARRRGVARGCSRRLRGRTVPTYPAGSGAEALDAAESLRLAGRAQDRRARGRAPQARRRRGPAGARRRPRLVSAAYDELAGRLGPRVVVQPLVDGTGEVALGTRARPAPRAAARAGRRRQPVEELLAERVVALPPTTPRRRRGGGRPLRQRRCGPVAAAATSLAPGRCGRGRGPDRARATATDWRRSTSTRWSSPTGAGGRRRPRPTPNRRVMTPGASLHAGSTFPGVASGRARGTAARSGRRPAGCGRARRTGPARGR